MTKLVSDLLVVARSDNKVLKMRPQNFNLSSLIEQTARLMQPLADQKHLRSRPQDCRKSRSRPMSRKSVSLS